MKKIQFACLLAILAAVVSFSSSAQAQIPHQNYASPAGSGTACSASAPCDLTVAILNASMGSADGMVSCINGGFSENNFQFGNNVTIDCPGAVLTANGSPAIVLNGGSQRVILRNLTFDGASDTLSAPLIQVTGGATLIIENCKFQNLDFINASSTGNGVTIQFLPNRPAAQLIIRDTLFAYNGIGGSGGGLLVAPAAGGSASVVLERVSFNFNVTSMALLGPVNATMINSTVSASRSNGILVGSGATLDIVDSKLVYNVGAAVSVTSGGTLRLSNTDIKSNQIGISNSGGQALSYKNNRITDNGSSAALTSIQSGQ